MSGYRTEGASATGVATLSGDRVLDVYYPEPRIGAWGAPGTRSTGQAAPDDDRRVRSLPVETSIASLADPPADAYDAYLRLHLLSHRMIRPHQANRRCSRPSSAASTRPANRSRSTRSTSSRG